MKIAILSDTHDHIPNLATAVKRCNTTGTGHLIHCGDLISPFMLPELAKFKGEVHLIYGNNPGDQHLISQRCGTLFPAIRHYGTMGTVRIDSRVIAFTHYPELAAGLAALNSYDVVCCGHNHTSGIERINNTQLINAGELLGKDEQPGFWILDSTTMQVERVEVSTRLVY